jgi:hypothetical protein
LPVRGRHDSTFGFGADFAVGVFEPGEPCAEDFARRVGQLEERRVFGEALADAGALR